MATEQAKDKAPAGDLVTESFFATYIYYKDFPDADELNASIKKHVRAWRAQDQEGIVRSNVKIAGSWHSGLDMNQREEYRELTTRIIATAQEVFEALGYDPGSEAACDNMWANISPRYGYNRNHIHPGVLWSGVYYVQAPPNSGRIFFTDPRAQAQIIRPRFDPDQPSRSNAWTEVYYEPIEGRMLLFPAWLVHEVEPNMADNEGPDADRISVSFNFYQKRREESQSP